ncbi:MAG: MATE family efflux transporter [Treponema sp.]|nr:MATE family efflux transporter [Candidatus Treponema scatequi]
MADSAKQFRLMTETPIPRLIIKLSIPTIISMLGTTIYNLVDTAFVGKLGTSQSGAVGVVFGFMTVLQAIGFMCGQGSGSIVSRRLGEKNIEEATRIASTGFFTSLVLGFIVAVFSLIFIDPLVVFFGSTPTIAPHAKTYLYFILSTAPCVVATFTLNNLLRYEGKAVLGMIGLLSGGILNIAGDAIFMFGFDMGIAGAGLSTAISQVIGFAILLGIFLSGKTQAKISIKSISFFSKRQSDILTTGLPSLVRQAFGGVATIILNQSAALVAGDAAIAALSIVSRVSFAIFAIALGIGQGFQPICAFNYGAKKYSRVRKAYKDAILFSTGILAVITVFALIFPGEIVGALRDDPKVIKIGIRALRLMCIAQLFMPLCMVTEMLLQSTGRKLSSLVLSSLRGGVLYIPLILILSKLRGVAGLQEAQPLAFMLSAVPGVICVVIYFKNLPKEDEK